MYHSCFQKMEGAEVLGAGGRCVTAEWRGILMHNITWSGKRKNEKNKVEAQMETERGEMDRRNRKKKLKNDFCYRRCVGVCTCEFILTQVYSSHSVRWVCFSTSGYRVALCLCYCAIPSEASSRHTSLLSHRKNNRCCHRIRQRKVKHDTWRAT